MLSIEGNIVNIDKVFRGRIEIDHSGMIHKIGEPTGDADFIFTDELIFPGFVDLHVHAREDTTHRDDYKEDFLTAGAAAINGGVVAFAEMPNNPVPPVDEASYYAKSDLALKCAVPVTLYMGIGPNTQPWESGPYKVYMGKSVGDLFFNSLEELESAIKKYEGHYVSFHCENPEMLEQYKHMLTHELQRPPAAEISGIDLAIYLIEKYRLRGKICHVSTAEGAIKIIEAKERGVNVTAEVTPHHLYFDETMIGLDRTKFQVNPPIRQTKENRLALISCLKYGNIDYLATDHAPHTIEEKEKGVSGFPHLDTYGPFVTWLMKDHNFTPEEIMRVCSKNPASFFNEFLFIEDGKFGEVKEGFVGSLTIIDMNKPITITKEILKTKCGWSPFEGVTFPGRVVMTIQQGEILKNEIK